MDTIRRLALAFSLVLSIGLSPAWAQTPAPDEAKPPPALGLTDAQQKLIYTSVSRQTHLSTASPPAFAAAVGAIVPEAIKLQPLPDTVVQVVPQTRGHAFALVANQVLLVEPKTRKVVEIIRPSS